MSHFTYIPAEYHPSLLFTEEMPDSFPTNNPNAWIVMPIQKGFIAPSRVLDSVVYHFKKTAPNHEEVLVHIRELLRNEFPEGWYIKVDDDCIRLHK